MRRLQNVSTTEVDFGGRAGNRAHSIDVIKREAVNGLRPQLARRHLIAKTR